MLRVRPGAVLRRDSGWSVGWRGFVRWIGGGGCKCVRPAFGRLQKFALRFARGSGAGTVVARADC